MASADILRAAHSPLPWHNPERSVQICSQDEAVLADCVGQETSRKADEANAAFIVRACNAHYQMLEALKQALADIEGGGHQSIELINAAIDKAEGR